MLTVSSEPSPSSSPYGQRIHPSVTGSALEESTRVENPLLTWEYRDPLALLQWPLQLPLSLWVFSPSSDGLSLVWGCASKDFSLRRLCVTSLPGTRSPILSSVKCCYLPGPQISNHVSDICFLSLVYKSVFSRSRIFLITSFQCVLIYISLIPLSLFFFKSVLFILDICCFTNFKWFDSLKQLY